MSHTQETIDGHEPLDNSQAGINSRDFTAALISMSKDIKECFYEGWEEIFPEKKIIKK